jgi:hypothetical protein
MATQTLRHHLCASPRECRKCNACHVRSHPDGHAGSSPAQHHEGCRKPKVRRLPRLQPPARPPSESATTSAKPLCECHACHIWNIPDGHPKSQQPALRSTSGVPRLPRLPRLEPSGRPPRESATASAQTLGSTENATPATPGTVQTATRRPPPPQDTEGSTYWKHPDGHPWSSQAPLRFLLFLNCWYWWWWWSL